MHAEIHYALRLVIRFEAAYPGQGVVVLRGGDHGAKLAAERRFRKPDGPHILVCTAAGREGINLQFARVLFNFDLPWNPMDVEQRIGRIHRYGQKDTAQVDRLSISPRGTRVSPLKRFPSDLNRWDSQRLMDERVFVH